MKYIFRLLGLLCILTALLQTQSCGPLLPEVPPPERVLLDEDFMAYVGLPDHSYWIYRNVETGEIDSSYIGGTDTIMQDPDYGRQVVTHLFESRFGSLHLRSNTYKCEWYVSKGLAMGKVRKFNYLALKKSVESAAIIVAFKDSTKIWEHNDNNLENFYTSFLDTLTVGGTEYHNVVQVSVSGGWESKVSIRQVYYAEGIGPIYREFADGSEWELIRCHLGENDTPLSCHYVNVNATKDL